MDILVNNKNTIFNKKDFPMLISGIDKTGTSFFSICLLANLLKAGEKVLFFSAYQAAKEAFAEQITNNKENAIVIESGEEEIFLEVIKNTPDLSERFLLIKNMEVYSEKVFEATKGLNLVIFSGDLDKCSFADKLVEKDFSSKIFFSQSEKYPQEGLGNLPKYFGKIIGNRINGIIKLDIK